MWLVNAYQNKTTEGILLHLISKLYFECINRKRWKIWMLPHNIDFFVSLFIQLLYFTNVSTKKEKIIFLIHLSLHTFVITSIYQQRFRIFTKNRVVWGEWRVLAASYSYEKKDRFSLCLRIWQRASQNWNKVNLKHHQKTNCKKMWRE